MYAPLHYAEFSRISRRVRRNILYQFPSLKPHTKIIKNQQNSRHVQAPDKTLSRERLNPISAQQTKILIPPRTLESINHAKRKRRGSPKTVDTRKIWITSKKIMHTADSDGCNRTTNRIRCTPRGKPSKTATVIVGCGTTVSSVITGYLRNANASYESVLHRSGFETVAIVHVHRLTPAV